MKTLAFLLVLLIPAKDINDQGLFKNGYFGNVKTVTQIMYFAFLDGDTYQEFEADIPKITLTKSYDGNNCLKLLKSQIDSFPGSLIYVKCNENCELLLQTHFDKRGKLTKKVVRKNDTLVETFNAESYLTGYTTKIEIDTNCYLQKSFNSKGVLTRQTKEKWDKFGKQVSIKGMWVNENDTTLFSRTFKYEEFDKAGNWTKQISIENGKLDTVRIYERIIKYR